MTKKRSIRDRWVLLGTIFLLLLVGSWFLASERANSRYQKLIGNREIFTAFTEGDSAKIATIAKQFKLYYQQIDNLTVSYSNGQDLPQPNFIGISRASSLGVLNESPEQSLKRLRPYRLFIDHRFYIMFPFFPNDSTSGYLVYAKVVRF
mgnify:CR=1 FL=1